MILVDTSVWVGHLRIGDVRLAELLEGNAVVMHPFIVGEIACGRLADRALTLDLLQHLPMAAVAESAEATSSAIVSMAKASVTSTFTCWLPQPWTE